MSWNASCCACCGQSLMTPYCRWLLQAFGALACMHPLTRHRSGCVTVSPHPPLFLVPCPTDDMAATESYIVLMHLPVCFDGAVGCLRACAPGTCDRDAWGASDCSST